MAHREKSAFDRLTQRIVGQAVRRARGGDEYVVHPEIGGVSLLAEMRMRSAALLRAQWRLRRVPGPRARFVEPGVVIEHRRQLLVGRGAVLERGVHLRCLSRDGFRIGDNVTIGRHSIVEGTGVLWHLAPGFEIGDGSSLGDWSFVGCGGGVRIGREVLVGQRLSVHSQNHRFDDPNESIHAQGVESQGVVIEDNCWIGANVTILDGVTIGEGSVVAAASVVTKSVPPYSVAAGNPARVLRSRKDAATSGTADPGDRPV